MSDDESKKVLGAPPESEASTTGDEAKPAQEYVVGYKQPPIASRFQPGTSGNRRGRSRGSRNLTTVLNDLMRKRYPVQEGGKVRMAPGTEVLGIKIFQNAVKGDRDSIDRVVEAQNAQERRSVKLRITSDMSAVEASKVYQRIIKGED